MHKLWGSVHHNGIVNDAHGCHVEDDNGDDDDDDDDGMQGYVGDINGSSDGDDGEDNYDDAYELFRIKCVMSCTHAARESEKLPLAQTISKGVMFRLNIDLRKFQGSVVAAEANCSYTLHAWARPLA